MSSFRCIGKEPVLPAYNKRSNRLLTSIIVRSKKPLIKTTGGKKNKKGTPQGGVISPLLANIYLNIVDKTVKRMEGYDEDIRIVRYADDFVLMGKEISKRIKGKLEAVLERMELTVNEEKTRTLDAEEETFDFLGFTFHKRRSRYKREDKYYHIQPSRKSQSKLKKRIKECLKANLRRAHNLVIKELNTIIKGWINYFRIDRYSYMWKPMNNLNGYLKESIYRYHKRKSQRYNKRYSQIAYYVWIKKYGLVDPTRYWREGTVNA